MAIIAVYLTGCASSRSGQVYSREHSRQAQTVENGTVESIKEVVIEGTKTPLELLQVVWQAVFWAARWEADQAELLPQ